MWAKELPYCIASGSFGVNIGGNKDMLTTMIVIKFAAFPLVPVPLEINTLRYLLKSELEHRKRKQV